MKYIATLICYLLLVIQTFGQSNAPSYFLDGRAVVLISAAPTARPPMSWTHMAKQVHPALVEAGGDPVAYYELEELILSEEVQTAYAQFFVRRHIGNIVLITRKSSGEFVLNVLPFSQNNTIVNQQSAWTLSGKTIEELEAALEIAGQNTKSLNLMPLDMATFPAPLVGGNSSAASSKSGESTAFSGKFIQKTPLNLDIFKLGVPLGGASGESALLATYRYDLYGKSAEAVEAAQKAEKASLMSVFNANYPYQVEYLDQIKTNKQLLADKVQFVLMRVEGREADLMESMGLDPSTALDKDRIVVKYYIKLLVRDELYLGPVWDADPNGNTALTKFLKNLEIPQK
ncbi:hypothetical protein [Echinicola pacifica]|nr:hypothetical protein [Echinicola pacifica]